MSYRIRETLNLILIILCYSFFGSVSSLSQSEHSVPSPLYLIKIDGSINPSTSDFIHKSINDAVSKNAQCLIIELNTPGGVLKSTRYIVSDILTSEIPIIVFVSPSGSQAASAGVFIALASHIAVMAPGTNIGASHPVGIDGKQDSIMNEKATNDAAAFIRSISEKRNRNVQWAEDAVRKSVSISETEALNLKVIDLIANNVDDLIQKLDGREVETSKGKIILKTKGANVITNKMSWFQKLLDVISDPNIAYILMMIGIWGIILEFYHPGGILPGVVGVICMVLGLYGLHALPINYAGLALILLAIILFIAEIKITSYGMLTVGGVISLLIGSFMLIDVESGLEVVQLSVSVVISTVLLVSLLFIVLIILVIRAHKRKVTTGTQGLAAEIGEVWENIEKGKTGLVKVHGELWNAESVNETDDVLQRGDRVKIVSVEKLKLKVQKI
ncbi:MAG: NfeD family protein [Ignavibacteria bacterium]